MSGIFITGTDTGCGKTEFTLLLMRLFQARGLKVSGMKPIASGAIQTPAGLRNDDALRLQAQSSVKVTYQQVNPYCFEAAVAPHIAAQLAHKTIQIETILTAYEQLHQTTDLVIVEGVGGVQVPLNDRQSLLDLMDQMKLPVILVAGMKLGWINHSLLSVESLKHHAIPLTGWISNPIETEMREQQANIDSLKKRIDSTYLGHIPVFNENFSEQRFFCEIWDFLPDSIQLIL